MKYIGIDGDNIGSKIELHFLENNEEAIQFFSETIEKTISLMASQLEESGMKIIFCAGDSILCRSDNIDTVKLQDTLKVGIKDGIYFSAGIGQSIRQAYLALKYAKTSGKNRIITLEDEEFVIDFE
jgi:GTP cyclohydrolase III